MSPEASCSVPDRVHADRYDAAVSYSRRENRVKSVAGRCFGLVAVDRCAAPVRGNVRRRYRPIDSHRTMRPITAGTYAHPSPAMPPMINR